MRYLAIVHHDRPEGPFGVTVPDLPGCFSAGDSLADALENARKAIALHVEGLLSDGEPVPAPAPIIDADRGIVAAVNVDEALDVAASPDRDARHGPCSPSVLRWPRARSVSAMRRAVVERRGTMRTGQMEQRVERVERRLDRIEQILPTLATRDDLQTAIEASEQRTRKYVREHIEASEQRVRTDLRTHFDVVAEALRHDIRLVAEAVAELSARVR